MADLLTTDQIDTALHDLPGWAREGASLMASLTAQTFLDGIHLVDQVAAAAEQLDHHPDIDIRWTTITFTLSSHSAGGITAADVELARKISAIAGTVGLAPRGATT